MVTVFISVVALIVAITISLISLWLNTLRGSDLCLIDEPTFELTDESFKHHYGELEYVPRYFNVKPTSCLCEQWS